MIDFALLGHPADYQHFTQLVDRAGERAQRFEKHRALMEKMVEWSPSYLTPDAIVMPLSDGRSLRGRVIICPFLPEMMSGPREMKQAYDKIDDGARLASEQGARLGALGGFTSIIENQMRATRRLDGGTAFTSGNSLTAAFAVRQVEDALAAAGRSLSERTVAIVGATGDIGRLAARLLAPRVRRLILIARFLPRIARLAESLSAPGRDIAVSGEIEAVRQADTVLLAAGARSAIADETLFARGALVSDIGYPKNVSYARTPRDDIAVFSGGLAQMPAPLGLSRFTRLPDEMLLFACYAEAIALSATPDGATLATEQGGIADLERVAMIEAAARGCGITHAPPWRGSVRLDGNMIARALEAA